MPSDRDDTQTPVRSNARAAVSGVVILGFELCTPPKNNKDDPSPATEQPVLEGSRVAIGMDAH